MSNHPIKILEQEQKSLLAEKQRIVATALQPYDKEITQWLKTINKKIRQTRRALYLLTNNKQAA